MVQLGLLCRSVCAQAVPPIRRGVAEADAAGRERMARLGYDPN